jgi:exonuclease SbcC
VEKLSESSLAARKEAEEAKKEVGELQRTIQGLDRKDDALKKKAQWIEQESGRLKKLEANVEGAKRQLKNLEDRTASRTKELSGLGEVKFSKETYDRARAERERLKPLRDEYVRLRGIEEEISRLGVESKEVEERVAKHRLEREGLVRLVKELEPKKAQYEHSLRTVDDKMNMLSKAKDDARAKANKRDSAKAELETLVRDLENIGRIKKSIESDGKRKDELAALEDVMVSFRDHLIGKIAPTLADLTSHILSAMTAERYSRVELGEGYEIQVDDEGVLHPIGRFSGGESDLANLALRLAISRVIAERTGANQINFLILDEIFGSLDPSRKRSVMIALAGLSVQFRQIFLITHIEDIKDLMNYVVKVERADDGTSTVSLES